MARLIGKIRRSPSGPFERGEELNPDLIAHVILKEKGKDNSRVPRWINFLQPVISGSYTADNLDYVLRDSYMCGVAVGPVDLTRLIHYSIITEKGFTIHKTGLPGPPDVPQHENVSLFQCVLPPHDASHRHSPARHLRRHHEALPSGRPPQENGRVLALTDWSLLEEVRGWKKSPQTSKRHLHGEWAHILGRDVKWKMAYSTVLKEKGKGARDGFPEPGTVPRKSSKNDLRPATRFSFVSTWPIGSTSRPKGYTRNSIIGLRSQHSSVFAEPLEEFLDLLPTRLVQFRLYALDHAHDAALSRAAATVLNKTPSSIENESVTPRLIRRFSPTPS